ncbi:TetR/AcrR family transcriptional regulator [Marinisporobacter balticus]|uniref:TetR family transcriptional regulator n=1 Tax=Marinisporobacter balticus TaxID=2018667 RepID=A0A4R2K987_9FIRM|nr:TetR/AcrR family transcriptional regulator [Marinisporobacter balticus]TCO68682.1 TetR family transcriptional regulator [Marinisporobacter balticus]
MSDTKENILHTALRLFARDGYEAVSVSAIAGELGMTKGALYKHYKNKRDIFDSIVERIYQMDYERAHEFEVPEEVFEKAPLPYQNTSVDKIDAFIKAQFSFWTEDEFGCNFRKMVTLEQYRNPDMAELYQKCLAGGPVDYMEDLFREMIEQGVLSKSNPKQLALEFYAPYYLLLSIYDVSPDKEKAKNLLVAHIEHFMKKNTAKMSKEKEQSQ